MRSILFCLLLAGTGGSAQTVSNMTCTSAPALEAMKGQHDPAAYAAGTVIDDHADILCELRGLVSSDSLLHSLEVLVSYGTRHSYSDTTSANYGIGAARRWCHDRFQAISALNEDRLLPAYLDFDYLGGDCGDAYGWRNVLAVLPGSDTTDHQVVLIEAHLDSRCEDVCDSLCLSPGAEDNASGSALVLELARVLSRFTFRHTLVFMLTTAEEQGLVGAEAMAQFCVDEDIAIKGVLNNDVIGGILCGSTSSPPSCPGEGLIDSLQVRLFSNSSISLPHRGFARTIKLFYEEKLKDQVPVPMTLSIMGQEDRTGRGGDHMPFRAEGFRNVRFTAAHEHGDADTGDPDYDDRQHTGTDVLGVDTDGDQLIDSLFVDPNYLARNTVINGMAATLLALGPETPEWILHDEPAGLRVEFTSGFDRLAYRVGVRNSSSSLDFDALYRTTDTSFLVPGLVSGSGYFISVAKVDSNGITSPFSGEVVRGNDADTPPAATDMLPYGLNCGPIGIGDPADRYPGLVLGPCSPDPFRGLTVFPLQVPEGLEARRAALVVRDLQGRELGRVVVPLRPGRVQVPYQHKGAAGVYSATLEVDGVLVATQRMVAEE